MKTIPIADYPEILNKNLCAQYLGVTVRTLNRLIEHGSFTCGRLIGPKTWRVHRDEVREYMLDKSHASELPPEPPAQPNRPKPKVVRARPKPPDMQPNRRGPQSEPGAVHARQRRA